MKERKRLNKYLLPIKDCSNSNYGDQIRSYFKNQLQETGVKSRQIQQTFSSRQIIKKGKYIMHTENPVPSQMSFNYKGLNYLPHNKVFSQFQIPKIIDFSKSTFILATQGNLQQISRKISPLNIRQSLRNKIMENVKHHKTKQKLPQLKKVDKRQNIRSQSDQKFIVWSNKEKQEYNHLSSNRIPCSSRIRKHIQLQKLIDAKQETKAMRKQKYSFFRELTPWNQNRHNRFQLQQT